MIKSIRNLILFSLIGGLAACHTPHINNQTEPAQIASIQAKIDVPNSKLPENELRKKGFTTQFIEPTDIYFANGQVTGNGIGAPINPSAPVNPFALPNGTNTVNVVFSNVPVGKNRVVTVTALDAAQAPIAAHYEIKGVTDVSTGGNTVTVSFQTTPTARVVEKIIADAHPSINFVNPTDIQTFVDRLVNNDTPSPLDDIHPTLIDHDAIALFIEANNVPPNPTPPITVPDRTAYTNIPGTVTGTISGLQEAYKLGAADETVFPPFTLVLNDPSSQAQITAAQVQAGVVPSLNYTINNVTPGVNYDLTLTSAYHQPQSAVVAVAAGGTTVQNFAVPAGAKQHFFANSIAPNANQVWRYQSATPIDILLIKPSPTDVTNAANKVSEWQAEGNALDNVGPNNGALNGGMGFTPSPFGQAFQLDGLDDFVLVPDHPSLQITGQLTISAQIRINDPNANNFMRIVSKKVNFTDADGYDMEYNPFLNRLTIIAGNGNIATANNVNLDTNWHHVAATINGSVANLYVDGINVTADNQVDPLVAGTTPLSIGRINSNSAFFDGDIDEVRIFNRELSAEEIAGTATVNALSWTTTNHLEAAKYAANQVQAIYGSAITIGNVDEVFDNDANFGVTPLPVLGANFPPDPADPNSPNHPANLNTNLVGRYDVYVRWRTDFCPGTNPGTAYKTFHGPLPGTYTTMIELATQDCTGDELPFNITRAVASRNLSDVIAGANSSPNASDLLFPTINMLNPLNLNPTALDNNTIRFLFDANATVTNIDRVP